MRRLALAILLVPLAGPALAQRIEVTPAAVIAGEPVRIVLKDLPRSAPVGVIAERPVAGWSADAGAKLYRAEATFRTTHTGTLDLATAQPLAGSYEGADLRGLFWSMAPTDDAVPPDWPATQVRLSARDGDRTIARATLTLRESSEDVMIEPVGDTLPGAILATLPGTARRPAIIVLGGSEGGDWFARSMAPRLASHGYAVLGLPYYASPFAPAKGLESLPKAFVDIPVDRLEQARDWLAQRDDVDAGRIGVYGVSKGAEFALIAATRFEWINAVAAIVPTDVVWEGWAIRLRRPGRARRSPGAASRCRSCLTTTSRPSSCAWVPAAPRCVARTTKAGRCRRSVRSTRAFRSKPFVASSWSQAACSTRSGRQVRWRRTSSSAARRPAFRRAR